MAPPRRSRRTACTVGTGRSRQAAPEQGSEAPEQGRAAPSTRASIGGIVRFRPPGRKNGRFRAWIRGIVRFPGPPERPSRALRAPIPAARDRSSRKAPGQGPVPASRRGRGGGRSSCPEDHRRTIPRFDCPKGREICPGAGNGPGLGDTEAGNAPSLGGRGAQGHSRGMQRVWALRRSGFLRSEYLSVT